MPIAANVTKSWEDSSIKMSGSLDTDLARSLSGKLATYVKMQTIDDFDQIEAFEGGYRHRHSNCWQGNVKYINGRVSHIRIINRETNAEVLSVKFSAWK